MTGTPPLWRLAEDGTVERRRDAEHWRPEAGKVRCGLCYRDCLLADGQAGPCGFRGAQDGRMQLRSHGVVSSVVRQVRGYQVDPFLTYKPGQTSVFFGGIQCTAACSFCMSTQLVHKPEAVGWALPPTAVAGGDSSWYGVKALLHPLDALRAVEHHGASSVTFGINEPTLSFEWTLDVARLAKDRGLDVVMETNGFTTPQAIAQLAPYVDAVDVGVKGSADPNFYARHMRSPGAVPVVLRALRLWRDAGVHVVVGDLLAAPHQQDDASFKQAARRFYDHLADALGPVTDVLVTQIMQPGPAQVGQLSTALTLARSGADEAAYQDRLDWALDLARAAGLPYAHPKLSQDQRIDCHVCGATLLRLREDCAAAWTRMSEAAQAAHDPCVMPRAYCPWWTHEQAVTDSRCDGCGAAVPIVALTADELAVERATVRESASALAG